MTNSKVVFQTTSRSRSSNRARALGMALVAVRSRWRARRSPTPDISDTAMAAPSSTSAIAATNTALAALEGTTVRAAASPGVTERPAMERKCKPPIDASTSNKPPARLAGPTSGPPTKQAVSATAKAVSIAAPCSGRFHSSRPGAVAPTRTA